MNPARLDKALGGYRVWVAGKVEFTTTDKALAEAWINAYETTVLQFTPTGAPQ